MAKAKKKKPPKLPELTYGMGSMDYDEVKEHIRYRKSVLGKSYTVYGHTPEECFEKMREKEQGVEKKAKKAQQITLSKGIWDWLELYKKPALKPKAYDAQANTIKYQILPYDLAKLQVQAITSNDIQKHLNCLVEKGYAHSTIKKAYMVLDQYFAHYYSNKDQRMNPMILVNAPTKGGMNEEDKEIEIMDDDDIELFIREATRKYGNGKPVYRHGCAMLGILFTGLRRGEALALQWNKVNFDSKILNVDKALCKVIDWDAPKKHDGTLTHKIIITTPKTKAGIRKVPLEENGLYYLRMQKANMDDVKPTDYVFATKSGAILGERNLTRLITTVQKNAGTKLQNSGPHMLRHTYISFLCREGIDKKVIAEIVGHRSTEIIEKIYQHVLDREKVEAVNSIKIKTEFKTNVKSFLYLAG